MSWAKRLRRRRPVVALVLVGGLMTGAGIALASGAAGTDSSSSAEETPSLSPQGQEDQARYDALEKWLSDWDAQKAAEASTEAPLDPDALRPSSSPDPWEDSLGGGGRGDFLYPERLGLSFESTWTHSNGSHYWAVYSGSSKDSDYGVLIVQRIVPETMESTFLRVDTDVKGNLSITGSNGLTIFISSNSGEDFSFDVSTLSSDDFPSKIPHVTQISKPW